MTTGHDRGGQGLRYYAVVRRPAIITRGPLDGIEVGATVRRGGHDAAVAGASSGPRVCGQASARARIAHVFFARRGDVFTVDMTSRPRRERSAAARGRLLAAVCGDVPAAIERSSSGQAVGARTCPRSSPIRRTPKRGAAGEGKRLVTSSRGEGHPRKECRLATTISRVDQPSDRRGSWREDPGRSRAEAKERYDEEAWCATKASSARRSMPSGGRGRAHRRAGRAEAMLAGSTFVDQRTRQESALVELARKTRARVAEKPIRAESCPRMDCRSATASLVSERRQFHPPHRRSPRSRARERTSDCLKRRPAFYERPETREAAPARRFAIVALPGCRGAKNLPIPLRKLLPLKKYPHPTPGTILDERRLHGTSSPSSSRKNGRG